MKFDNVSIVGVAHVDAPHRIPSEDLDARMAETYRRLGMPMRLLESLTGVKARRFWMCRPSPAMRPRWRGARFWPTRAWIPGASARSSIPRCAATMSSRSVACFVHANLGLAETCLNFDIANACLGFIDGMHMVGNLIERGQIEFGLIVDGKAAAPVVEATLARLSQDSCECADAARPARHLDRGVGRRSHDPGAHTPGTRRSSLPRRDQSGRDGAQSTLPRPARRRHHRHAQPVAPRRGASATDLAQAQKDLGWSAESVDLFALHQVSELHTQELAPRGRLRSRQSISHLPGAGQRGPCFGSDRSVESRGSRTRVAGRSRGARGIGSGLNCTVAGVTW